MTAKQTLGSFSEGTYHCS